ncbi:MAG: dephospho-CoA kinase [Clostridiales bacterium]|nr:dephospho-CoA kinase [Clostridiales bacterium]
MMRNDNCMFIGLTGGIGSGKSTVTSYLKSKDYIVIDADVLSKTVVEPGEKAYFDIVAEFGESILNGDGSINRKQLGDIIFQDEVQRKKLNEIVHPEVRRLMMELLHEFSFHNSIVFADIPLLIESDLMSTFDAIWLVYAAEDICLERIMKRDGISREDALLRIRAQMAIDEKKIVSDLILYNTADVEFLFRQIDEALILSINK